MVDERIREHFRTPREHRDYLHNAAALGLIPLAVAERRTQRITERLRQAAARAKLTGKARRAVQ
jgi:hypothetical protein